MDSVYDARFSPVYFLGEGAIRVGGARRPPENRAKKWGDVNPGLFWAVFFLSYLFIPAQNRPGTAFLLPYFSPPPCRPQPGGRSPGPMVRRGKKIGGKKLVPFHSLRPNIGLEAAKCIPKKITGKNSRFQANILFYKRIFFPCIIF